MTKARRTRQFARTFLASPLIRALAKQTGDEVDFHPVRRANFKWPIKEATTLNRPSNKRYLKLTSMGFSNKAVTYLPPVSAAS